MAIVADNKRVKNTAAFAVVTASGEVIPPMQTSKGLVNVLKKDTAALIKRGVLEVVATWPSDTDADAQGGESIDPATMKAAQIKTELDKLGVEYAGNASTEVLRELYLAELAKQKEL